MSKLVDPQVMEYVPETVYCVMKRYGQIPLLAVFFWAGVGLGFFFGFPKISENPSIASVL